MIDEKKLIEGLNYYISHTGEEDAEHYAYEQCKKLVEQQPKLGQWIPVEEMLPTNADRIRAMNDEELADFFFESPEIEFAVCEYCQYFGGHTSDTPCKHDMGLCFVPAKNEAFKKWLKQPAE